ncbi:MAG: hypothetical protein CVV21_06670 [Candidatus Goldiibacteriota bacterium HGW-Goldbacteria-1]|jgi:hypothetical protein|nr:MAG: hypothetical protein CVV21_06670 [Candidatus Goldiibacteriota bacterium HGW-Goldbacteria-1]
MKKKATKTGKPVSVKRKKKVKPVIEPVIAISEPPKKTNLFIKLFKFLFAVISFPFKAAAKLGKKTKMVLLALIGAAVFMAMAGFSWITQPLAAFYAFILLPFEYVRVARFDLALPPYFTVNFLIFILCAAWFLKQLPADEKRTAEKQAGFKIGITIPLVLVGYGILVWLFLNNKHYMAQNILFFALLIISGLYFAALDLKNEPVSDANAFPDAKEFGRLLIFAAVMLVVYMFDWKSWRYSFIGDEYAFYEYAKGMIKGSTLPKMLYEDGVYGYHPVWSSVYQSLFMHINPFFGWKLSTALIPAVSIIPLYLWTRMVFNKSTAAVASVAFAFALPILAFAHLSHNNIHSIMPLVAGILFLELAIRRNSHFWTFVAAAVIGMGCYSFYSGRLVPVLGVIYWFFHPLRRQYSWNRIIPGILLFLGTIIFIVINPKFVDHLTMQSFVTGSEISNPADRPLFLIMNYFHAFFAFIYRELMSHYVPGRTADLVSAFGIFAGLTWAVVAFFRDWRARFLLVGYAVLVFFIGAIVQYSYPPNTRLIFLSPMLAILAAVGITRLAAAVSKGKNGAKIYKGILITVMAGIIASSAYKFYIYMPKVFPYTAEAVAVRYILEDGKKKSIVLVSKEFHMLNLLSELYGFRARFERMDPEVFEAVLNRDELKGKAVILSASTAAMKPGIDNLVKDGKILYNEMHRQILFVYDFSDEQYYAAFREYWNTGSTQYAVERGPVKTPVVRGKLYSPSFARHEPRRKTAAKIAAADGKKSNIFSAFAQVSVQSGDQQVSPGFEYKPIDNFSGICKNTDYKAPIPLREAKVTKIKCEAEFDTPSDIAVSLDGNRMFIADGMAYKVYILEKQADIYKLKKTISMATKKGVFGDVDDRPQDLKEHAYMELDQQAGMLYVMDVNKDTIRQFDFDGNEKKTIVFNSFVHGARSIALSKDNSTFAVSSPGKNLLVFFGSNGQPMGYYATSTGGSCGQMSQPCYVTFDSKGNRYVLDTINRRVQVFSPDMKYIRSFEIGTASTIHGPQIEIFENTPEPFMAISIQSTKNILFITLDGKKARTVEMRGDNMSFVNPSSMDVDVNGNIYVLDPRTKEIAKVELPAEPMK